MWKNVFFIFILTLTYTAFTQPKENKKSNAHLTFKGVPIDGTLSEFVEKMKSKGFTHISTEDEVATLKGDFALFKNCIVEVSTYKQIDLVSRIYVIFPENGNCSDASYDYFSLKKMLIEKYGNPAVVVEENQDDEPSDFVEAIITAIRCEYYSTFKTEKGIVHLSIEKDKLSEYYVLLSYCDKINDEIIKAKAKEDL
jgi:hypothetical protein